MGVSTRFQPTKGHAPTVGRVLFRLPSITGTTSGLRRVRVLHAFVTKDHIPASWAGVRVSMSRFTNDNAADCVHRCGSFKMSANPTLIDQIHFTLTARYRLWADDNVHRVIFFCANKLQEIHQILHPLLANLPIYR